MDTRVEIRVGRLPVELPCPKPPAPPHKSFNERFRANVVTFSFCQSVLGAWLACESEHSDTSRPENSGRKSRSCARLQNLSSLDDITSESKGRSSTVSPNETGALYRLATSHLDDEQPHRVRFFYPLILGAETIHKTLTGGLGRGTRSMLQQNYRPPARCGKKKVCHALF
jgi:hypothetical protein